MSEEGDVGGVWNRGPMVDCEALLRGDCTLTLGLFPFGL